MTVKAQVIKERESYYFSIMLFRSDFFFIRAKGVGLKRVKGVDFCFFFDLNKKNTAFLFDRSFFLYTKSVFWFISRSIIVSYNTYIIMFYYMH